MNLVTLRDDLRFFPQYKAVFLYRLDTDPKAVASLRKLEGTIDEARMIRLNAEAERTKDYSSAASLYFAGKGQKPAEPERESAGHEIAVLTVQHLKLVGISLLLA